jgi:hypothetical protein
MADESNLYIVDAEFIQTASSLGDYGTALAGAAGQLYNSLEYLCKCEKGRYVETIKAEVLPELQDLTNKVQDHTDTVQSEIGIFLDQVDSDDTRLYGG